MLRSSPVGDPLIGTGPMKRRNIDQPVPESKNSNPGDSLVVPGEGNVAEVVALTPVFLDNVDTSNINDNDSVCPTSVNKVTHRLDKNVCQKSVQTVHSSMLDSLSSKITKKQPFKMRPPLTRSPVVQSGYANPVKKRLLKEALQALMQKLVVEKVVVRSSLAFYNRLFLVP